MRIRVDMGRAAGGGSNVLAGQLSAMRTATAKYATNLGAAKADGYQIITKMMPNMGFHFLNKNAKTCAKTAPHTGATFTFWHPDLITMHVWVWYPNPAGLFASTNPLNAPFGRG